MILVFDGDVTGKTVVDNMVKISDTPMDLTNVVKITMAIHPNIQEWFGAESVDFTPDMWTVREDGHNQVITDGSQSIVISIKTATASYPVGLYVATQPTDGYLGTWTSRVEFAETTTPISFIEYLANPKYHMGKPFRGFIGWKMAQGGGSADGEPALVSSDGYTLQDVNGLNLIPKEDE